MSVGSGDREKSENYQILLGSKLQSKYIKDTTKGRKAQELLYLPQFHCSIHISFFSRTLTYKW